MTENAKKLQKALQEGSMCPQGMGMMDILKAAEELIFMGLADVQNNDVEQVVG